MVYAEATPFVRSSSTCLHYLARYTHRVAISKPPDLSSFSDGSGYVPLEGLRPRQQAKADDTSAADEFLRRFLLHVLPRGFVRIRFFGFLSRRTRAHLLPICRRMVGAPTARKDRGDTRCIGTAYLPSLRRSNGYHPAVCLAKVAFKLESARLE